MAERKETTTLEIKVDASGGISSIDEFVDVVETKIKRIKASVDNLNRATADAGKVRTDIASGNIPARYASFNAAEANAAMNSAFEAAEKDLFGWQKLVETRITKLSQKMYRGLREGLVKFDQIDGMLKKFESDISNDFFGKRLTGNALKSSLMGKFGDKIGSIFYAMVRDSVEVVKDTLNKSIDPINKIGPRSFDFDKVIASRMNSLILDMVYSLVVNPIENAGNTVQSALAKGMQRLSSMSTLSRMRLNSSNLEREISSSFDFASNFGRYEKMAQRLLFGGSARTGTAEKLRIAIDTGDVKSAIELLDRLWEKEQRLKNVRAEIGRSERRSVIPTYPELDEARRREAGVPRATRRAPAAPDAATAAREAELRKAAHEFDKRMDDALREITKDQTRIQSDIERIIRGSRNKALSGKSDLVSDLRRIKELTEELIDNDLKSHYNRIAKEIDDISKINAGGIIGRINRLRMGASLASSGARGIYQAGVSRMTGGGGGGIPSGTPPGGMPPGGGGSDGFFGDFRRRLLGVKNAYIESHNAMQRGNEGVKQQVSGLTSILRSFNPDQALQSFMSMPRRIISMMWQLNHAYFFIRNVVQGIGNVFTTMTSGFKGQDDLLEMKERLGLPLSALRQLSTAAKLSGTSIAEMQTALKQVNISLDSATSDKPKDSGYVAAYKMLAEKTGRDAKQFIEEIRSRKVNAFDIQNMVAELLRTSEMTPAITKMLTKIGGRSAYKLGPVGDILGREDFPALLALMDNLGVSIGSTEEEMTKFAKIGKELNIIFMILKETFSGMINQLNIGLGPAFLASMKIITSTLSSFNIPSTFRDLGSRLGESLLDTTIRVTQRIRELKNQWESINLSTNLNRATDRINFLGDVAQEIGNYLGRAFSGAITKVLPIAVKLGLDLGKGFISGLFEGVRGDAIGTAIIGMFSGITIARAIRSGLGGTLKAGIGEALVDIFTLKNLPVGLASLITSPMIAAFGSAFIAVSALAQNDPRLSQFAEIIKSKISMAFSYLVTQAKKFAYDIGSALSGAGSINIGSDLIKSILNIGSQIFIAGLEIAKSFFKGLNSGVDPRGIRDIFNNVLLIAGTFLTLGFSSIAGGLASAFIGGLSGFDRANTQMMFLLGALAAKASLAAGTAGLSIGTTVAGSIGAGLTAGLATFALAVVFAKYWFDTLEPVYSQARQVGLTIGDSLKFAFLQSINDSKISKGIADLMVTFTKVKNFFTGNKEFELKAISNLGFDSYESLQQKKFDDLQKFYQRPSFKPPTTRDEAFANAGELFPPKPGESSLDWADRQVAIFENQSSLYKAIWERAGEESALEFQTAVTDAILESFVGIDWEKYGRDAGERLAQGFSGGFQVIPSEMEGGRPGRNVPLNQTREEVRDMVIAAAQRYGVNPRVAVEVAARESRFNPNVAVGGAGEIGIMQITPGTRKHLGLSDRDAWKPEKNIDAGVRYLREMIDRYNGDIERALRAYNGGPGNEDKGGASKAARIYGRAVIANANAGVNFFTKAGDKARSPMLTQIGLDDKQRNEIDEKIKWYKGKIDEVEKRLKQSNTPDQKKSILVEKNALMGQVALLEQEKVTNKLIEQREKIKQIFSSPITDMRTELQPFVDSGAVQKQTLDKAVALPADKQDEAKALVLADVTNKIADAKANVKDATEKLKVAEEESNASFTNFADEENERAKERQRQIEEERRALNKLDEEYLAASVRLKTLSEGKEKNPVVTGIIAQAQAEGVKNDVVGSPEGQAKLLVKYSAKKFGDDLQRERESTYEATSANEEYIRVVNQKMEAGMSFAQAQKFANGIMQQAAAANIAYALAAEIASRGYTEDAANLRKLADGLLQEASARQEAAQSRENFDQTGQLNAELSQINERIKLQEQFNAGLISELELKQQLAGVGEDNPDAKKIKAEIEARKQVEEQAKKGMINTGDMLRGGLSQIWDTAIEGGKDFGSTMKNIGQQWSRQLFSATLESKLGFDKNVQGNFLSLGKFGNSVFGSMFDGVTESLGFGKISELFDGADASGGGAAGKAAGLGGLFGKLGGWLSGFGGSEPAPDPTGGGYTGVGSLAYTGEQSQFPIPGMGAGDAGKAVQSPGFLSGLSKGIGSLFGAGDKGITGIPGIGPMLGKIGGGISSMMGGAGSALSSVFGPMVSGLGSMLPGIGSALSMITTILPMLMPLLEDLFDTTTGGTKVRREGEGFLDESKVFGKLQEPGRLGDFTRDSSIGVDNKVKEEYQADQVYEKGKELAKGRGMSGKQADIVAGGGGAIFSFLFADKSNTELVDGAVQMGRGIAELLSRGIAEGMTYDEMNEALYDLAKENDITFKDALKAVTEFGEAANEVWSDRGHPEWGAEQFAEQLYGVTKIFEKDFPRGVNLAGLAIQTMEKDGVKAFANLDAQTKDWINSVANDPEAFKKLIADLQLKGYKIDLVEFNNTIKDMVASAEVVNKSIEGVFTADSWSDAVSGIKKSITEQLGGALTDTLTDQLFGEEMLAVVFQDFFALLRGVKDGIIDISTEAGRAGFLTMITDSIGKGSAELGKYLPQIKAMYNEWKRVEKIVDEALKPSPDEEKWMWMEEQLKKNTEAAKQFAKAIYDAVAESESVVSGIKSRQKIDETINEDIDSGVADVFSDSLKESPLGKAYAEAKTEYEALLKSYLEDGKIDEQEAAQLSIAREKAYKAGSAFAQGISDNAAMINRSISVNLEKAKDNVRDAFGSGIDEGFNVLREGGSMTEALDAAKGSFKESIYEAVLDGMRTAIVESLIVDGVLAEKIALFRTAIANAMSDGGISEDERIFLEAMGKDLFQTADMASDLVGPIFGDILGIADSLIVPFERLEKKAKESIKSSMESATSGVTDNIMKGMSVKASMADFESSFKEGITKAVLEGMMAAIVAAALQTAALAPLMAALQEAIRKALENDGQIDAAELAGIKGLAGQVVTVAGEVVTAISPVVEMVAGVGVSMVDAAEIAEKAAKDLMTSAADAAISPVFDAAMAGNDTKPALDAMSRNFRKSIAESIMNGIKEAIITAALQSATLAPLIAALQKAITDALEDGKIDDAEMAKIRAAGSAVRTGAEAFVEIMSPVIEDMAGIGDTLYDAADRFAERVEEMKSTLGDGLGSAIQAGMDELATAEGTTQSAIEKIGEEFRKVVRQQVENAIIEAVVNAAVIQGVLAPMIIILTQMITAALVDGIISATENSAILDYIGSIFGEADRVLAQMGPIFESILGWSQQSRDQAGEEKEIKNTYKDPYPQYPAGTVYSSGFLGGARAAKTPEEIAAERATTANNRLADSGNKAADALDRIPLTRNGQEYAPPPDEFVGRGITPPPGGIRPSPIGRGGSGGEGDTTGQGRTGLGTSELTMLAQIFADGVISPEELETLKKMSASGIIKPEQESLLKDIFKDGIVTPEEMNVLKDIFGTPGTNRGDNPIGRGGDGSGGQGGGGTNDQGRTGLGRGGADESGNQAGDQGRRGPGSTDTTEDKVRLQQAISDIIASLKTLDTGIIESKDKLVGAIQELVDVILNNGFVSQGGRESLSRGNTGEDSANPNEGSAENSSLLQFISDSLNAFGSAIAATTISIEEERIKIQATIASLNENLGLTAPINLSDLISSIEKNFIDASSIINTFIATTQIVNPDGLKATMDMLANMIAPDRAAAISSAFAQVVSLQVADGIIALSRSMGSDAPYLIIEGLLALEREINSERTGTITSGIRSAMSSLQGVVGLTSQIFSALNPYLIDLYQKFYATSQGGTTDPSFPTPAAAIGGQFAAGSAVVGEMGKPELVTALPGGGFEVTPLEWNQAKELMSGSPLTKPIRGFATGGKSKLGRPGGTGGGSGEKYGDITWTRGPGGGTGGGGRDGNWGRGGDGDNKSDGSDDKRDGSRAGECPPVAWTWKGGNLYPGQTVNPGDNIPCSMYGYDGYWPNCKDKKTGEEIDLDCIYWGCMKDGRGFQNNKGCWRGYDQMMNDGGWYDHRDGEWGRFKDGSQWGGTGPRRTGGGGNAADNDTGAGRTVYQTGGSRAVYGGGTNSGGRNFGSGGTGGNSGSYGGNRGSGNNTGGGTSGSNQAGNQSGGNPDKPWLDYSGSGKFYNAKVPRDKYMWRYLIPTIIDNIWRGQNSTSPTVMWPDLTKKPPKLILGQQDIYEMERYKWDLNPANEILWTDVPELGPYGPDLIRKLPAMDKKDPRYKPLRDLQEKLYPWREAQKHSMDIVYYSDLKKVSSETYPTLGNKEGKTSKMPLRRFSPNPRDTYYWGVYFPTTGQDVWQGYREMHRLYWPDLNKRPYYIFSPDMMTRPGSTTTGRTSYEEAQDFDWNPIEWYNVPAFRGVSGDPENCKDGACYTKFPLMPKDDPRYKELVDAREKLYPEERARKQLRFGNYPVLGQGGSVVDGAAIVGERGMPELVEALPGGGFEVTPLGWNEARDLMAGNTPAFGCGGKCTTKSCGAGCKVKGMAQGGAMGGAGRSAAEPAGTGGGGTDFGPSPDSIEHAAGAITQAFVDAFAQMGDFADEFAKSLGLSIQKELVNAVVAGFIEGGQLTGDMQAIDALITEAYELSKSGGLTAEKMAEYSQKAAEQAREVAKKAAEFEKIIAPIRQMIAVSEAVKKNLDFTGMLSDLAQNVGLLGELAQIPIGGELPPSLEKDISDTFMRATLDGIIAGILAGGPVKEALDAAMAPFNSAVETAFADLKITPEEMLDIKGAGEKAAKDVGGIFQGLAPGFAALGIDLGEGIIAAADFSGLLNQIATNPTDADAVGMMLRDTVSKAVLDGILEGMLTSGPLKNSIDSLNMELTEAMNAAKADGVITEEEIENMKTIAKEGSAQIREDVEALTPAVEAAGEAFSTKLNDTIRQVLDSAKSGLASAMSEMLSPENMGKATIKVDNKELNKTDAFLLKFKRSLYGTIVDTMTRGFSDALLKSAVFGNMIKYLTQWINAIVDGDLEKAERKRQRFLDTLTQLKDNLPAITNAFKEAMGLAQEVLDQLDIGVSDFNEGTAEGTDNMEKSLRDYRGMKDEQCGEQCDQQYRLARFGLGTDILDMFGRGAGFTAGAPTAIPNGGTTPGGGGGGGGGSTIEARGSFQDTEYGSNNNPGSFDSNRYNYFEEYPSEKYNRAEEYNALVNKKVFYDRIALDFLDKYLTNQMFQFVPKSETERNRFKNTKEFGEWKTIASEVAREASLQADTSSPDRFLRDVWNRVGKEWTEPLLAFRAFENNYYDPNKSFYPGGEGARRKDITTWLPDLTKFGSEYATDRFGNTGYTGGQLPGYAQGGVASGPMSGYPVMLHGTEAIIPLDGNRVRTSSGKAPDIIIDGESVGNNNSQVKILEERISRLEAAIANLVDAIGSQPIEVSVQIDDNELMRSVERVGRRAGRSGKRLIDTNSVSK